MFNSVKIIVVLTIVGLLSGGFLTFVYQKTAPEIERKRLESLRKAIFVVLPEADDYKELRLKDDVIYQGVDKSGKEVGFAFLVQGTGFQGEIKIMVGASQDLNKIQNIYVLESVETPGLGGKITEKDFQQQFKGLTIKEEIKLLKGPRPKYVEAVSRTGVDAITGATISSKAVVDNINRRITAVKRIMKERK
jgi:electron transport complex protein RnfG